MKLNNPARIARINAGLSVEEAASSLKIHKNSLYMIETYKRKLTIRVAIKMADLYGVETKKLMR